VVTILAVANLADVDFVIGALSTGYTSLFAHHGITHGLPAALVAGVVGALAARYAGFSWDNVLVIAQEVLVVGGFLAVARIAVSVRRRPRPRAACRGW